MVKRTAAPKGRKRPRKAEDIARDEDAAGFFLLDDDDQRQQQQHSEEEDEEQQETAEQKRVRLGEVSICAGWYIDS